jgi:hypothetical protein
MMQKRGSEIEFSSYREDIQGRREEQLRVHVLEARVSRSEDAISSWSEGLIVVPQRLKNRGGGKAAPDEQRHSVLQGG